MDELELLQQIGNEVCENCGDDSDCGIAPVNCDRIKTAEELLNDFLVSNMIR